MHRNAMDETGSAFAPSVASDTFAATQSTLAIAVSHRLDLTNGVVIEPVSSIGWRHDFDGVDQSVTLDLSSVPFTTQAAPFGDDAFRAARCHRAGLGSLCARRFLGGKAVRQPRRLQLRGSGDASVMRAVAPGAFTTCHKAANMAKETLSRHFRHVSQFGGDLG